jgi:glycosyltransferase involved in cell wall biosynthesis
MNELSKISVVLPSLDPDEKLNAVIDGLLEHGFTDIILVNDGSKPENLHYFEDVAAQHPQIHLLHHEVNRGKGAALKTAFEGRGEAEHVEAEKATYPSDQKSFAKSLAIAAMKKGPKIGYYLDRIHTPKDTVLKEENILRIAEALSDMAGKYLEWAKRESASADSFYIRAISTARLDGMGEI